MPIIFMTTCGPKDGWERFGARNVSSKDESYSDLVFVDSLTGYLAGKKMVLLDDVKNQTKFPDQVRFVDSAVLYKTTTRGDSWTRIPTKFKGSIEKLFPFKDTLVVLIQDVMEDSVFILKSIGGTKWRKILALPKENYIRDISFVNANTGYIALDNHTSQHLLSFRNDAWNTLLTLPPNSFHHRIYKNKVVSLISSGAYIQELLVADTLSRKTSEVLFDKSYSISSSTKYGDDLFIAANDGKEGKILKFTNNKVQVIRLNQFSDYFPSSLFIFNQTIVAIVSKYGDGSILGVTHFLLISKDGGGSWALHEIDFPLLVEPAIMYKDEYFMTFSGAGSFQLRKLN